MKSYMMIEDSGAREIIEAENINDALEHAKEWAAEGSYDQRVMVHVGVSEVDEDGEPVEDGDRDFADVEAGPLPQPEETECGTEDSDHDWQAPEWLGGCRENPGVWSTGGTSLKITEVCGKCGMYKIVRLSGAQRNPGDLEEEIEYESADEQALKWIAS